MLHINFTVESLHQSAEDEFRKFIQQNFKKIQNESKITYETRQKVD